MPRPPLLLGAPADAHLLSTQRVGIHRRVRNRAVERRLARCSACVSPVQMASRQAWAGAQGFLLPSHPAAAEGRLDRTACLS
ncbi:hypothetical protein GOODEAATRI_013356 [Goodea atripinnis]|uniref:Uncharacterized protein n=1 Tax=Goodea atripinnis TaxID=208336 RepID=A0ABV0N115_9TELE